MKKKTVLILSFSFINSDPRVQRQINALKDDYNVTVLGFNSYQNEKVEFISILPPQKRKNKYRDAVMLLTGMYETYYEGITYIAEASQKLKGRAFDIIVANDIEALPIAIKKFPKAKVWYDAHEYAPREFEESKQWRIFFQRYKYYLCKKYMPLAKVVTTVSSGISDEFLKQFNVSSSVIRNAPSFSNLKPSEVSADSIKMIHHGAAIRNRNIELMMSLMEHLDSRFHLSLMLLPTDQDYLNELVQASIGKQNISFLPVVPMPEIPQFINRFDLGVFLLKPVNFNQLHTLPNKLFEYVQGRLGIIVGPSLEMEKVVNEYSLGLVTDNFDLEKMAKKINELTAKDIAIYKQNSHKHAQELSFESEERKIKEIISRLTNGN